MVLAILHQFTGKCESMHAAVGRQGWWAVAAVEAVGAGAAEIAVAEDPRHPRDASRPRLRMPPGTWGPLGCFANHCMSVFLAPTLR